MSSAGSSATRGSERRLAMDRVLRTSPSTFLCRARELLAVTGLGARSPGARALREAWVPPASSLSFTFSPSPPLPEFRVLERERCRQKGELAAFRQVTCGSGRPRAILLAGCWGLDASRASTKLSRCCWGFCLYLRDAAAGPGVMSDAQTLCKCLQADVKWTWMKQDFRERSDWSWVT